MGINAEMKQVHLISYEYPDTVKILISPYVYVYQSSEPMCRRFINGLNYGLGFHAFNWFKKQAKLMNKEKTCQEKEIQNV